MALVANLTVGEVARVTPKQVQHPSSLCTEIIMFLLPGERRYPQLHAHPFHIRAHSWWRQSLPNREGRALLRGRQEAVLQQLREDTRSWTGLYLGAGSC